MQANTRRTTVSAWALHHGLLVLGLVGLVLAAGKLKPLGVALVMAPLVAIGCLLVASFDLRRLARLVLGAQVFLGTFVSSSWLASKVVPPSTAAGQPVMPTGQVGIAASIAAMAAFAFFVVASRLRKRPARAEGIWLLASALAFALGTLRP